MPDPDRSASPSDTPEPPLARAVLLRRKRRDASTALLLLGAFLLASPFLDVVARTALPVGALYVFGAWFALIAGAARLSRGLSEDDGAH